MRYLVAAAGGAMAMFGLFMVHPIVGCLGGGLMLFVLACYMPDRSLEDSDVAERVAEFHALGALTEQQEDGLEDHDTADADASKG